ncbi:MAG: ABC transporter substrate-binding protein [Deltaproteobacteria bacterium]|nr:ABC transporter substrate-binding protein [Deltaproteobacteria bacterium]
MRLPIAFSTKLLQAVRLFATGARDCLLIAGFVLTILSSLSRAQSAPLFRIAYGMTSEMPTAVWLGVEQGFYRKHGLNVEAIYMRSGPLSMSAMASGDVQMVFTSANNVLNGAAAGLDVVVVANVIAHGEGIFMARPEIQKPEDLRGKRVAIQSIGGGGWANNMLALDYLNLDPERDKIQFIVLGDQPSRAQALESGRVQASWLGYAFSEPLKKKGYTAFVDLGRAPISYLGPSLSTRRQFVRQDPKPIEGIIKGTLDAVRYVRKPENKPVVTKTIMRHLRLSRPEEAEVSYHAIQQLYSNDLVPKAASVKKIHQILSKANPNLRKMNPEEVVEDSLILRIHASGY